MGEEDSESEKSSRKLNKRKGNLWWRKQHWYWMESRSFKDPLLRKTGGQAGSGLGRVAEQRRLNGDTRIHDHGILSHSFNNHLLSSSCVPGLIVSTEEKSQSLPSDRKDRNTNESWNLHSTYYAPATLLFKATHLNNNHMREVLLSSLFSRQGN